VLEIGGEVEELMELRIAGRGPGVGQEDVWPEQGGDQSQLHEQSQTGSGQGASVPTEQPPEDDPDRQLRLQRQEGEQAAGRSGMVAAVQAEAGHQDRQDQGGELSGPDCWPLLALHHKLSISVSSLDG
jgi:hypothetical protein